MLASADGVLAAFAAADLAGRTDRPVRVLAGGTRAWRQAGLPIATEIAEPLHPSKMSGSPLIQEPDRHAAFRTYLDWEIGLVAQLEQDGTTRFRVFPVEPGCRGAGGRVAPPTPPRPPAMG